MREDEVLSERGEGEMKVEVVEASESERGRSSGIEG